LGLTVPGLFALQVRAIAQAAARRVKAGGQPLAEIMIPLVGSVMELHLIRDELDTILAEVRATEGVDLRIPVGPWSSYPARH
jgi:pyruvate,orthophosphate dikinase